jgi:heme-degrading monooxygenase HmoA
MRTPVVSTGRQRQEKAMFAVIFAVQPKAERRSDYLDLAKFLRPKLETTDGFVENERFESRRTRGRLLSLSIWSDEKALIRWRVQSEHHGAQEKGRFEIFENYRLWVGEITDHLGVPNGLTVHATRLDETAVGAAKVATVTELTLTEQDRDGAMTDTLPERLGLAPHLDGLVDLEVFDSISNPGKLLLLAFWRNVETAKRWRPVYPAVAEKARHLHVRIIRDYGMFDRREAPQYYREVKPARGVAAE